MEKQKKSKDSCCGGGGSNSAEFSHGNGIKLAQSNSSQKECKIVFLGDKSVGKSSIALRFYKDEFSPSYNLTIGGAYIQTQITLKNSQTLKIHLWDTGGDERFRSMANLYYREAKAAILVYDVSDLSSFNGIDYWIKELEEAVEKDKMILALAGNKCDLPPAARQVPFEKAKSYAQEHNLIFLETSAKSGLGIQDLFSKISEEIYKNLQSQ